MSDSGEDNDGDEDDQSSFEPHPIARLLRSAFDAGKQAESNACGDFATFGTAALPLPGLSIHSAVGGYNSPTNALEVSLPLNQAHSIDQLKARCSLAKDETAVWEMNAKHFSAENPAFHHAVSATPRARALVLKSLNHHAVCRK
jgi:hypothetical protein